MVTANLKRNLCNVAIKNFLHPRFSTCHDNKGTKDIGIIDFDVSDHTKITQTGIIKPCFEDVP
jgi:hypothetical protein